MSDDDDVLKDYDLEAWDVPAPPDDLADGVIARLGGTEVGAAVPVDPATTRRRALLIGGVAAAVIAASLGTYALIGSSRHDAPTRGAVLADRAQALSIEGVKADLDPGADVRWTRDGKRVHVEQREGTAAWRVDARTSLVIDAGATVASVEATGSASLRVEVQMNSMDTKIIGASALTAAAVAMVTVVVYEGHVKVSSAGHQTVIVEPGSTWQSAPPEPVVAGTPGEDETPPQPASAGGSAAEVTVGESCDEVSCVLDNYAGACCAKLRAKKRSDAAATCDEVSCVLDNYAGACCTKLRAKKGSDAAATCDEVSCVLDNYAGACCQKFRAGSQGKTLDRVAITDGVEKVKARVLACGDKFPGRGVVKIAVWVRPEGTVERVEVKQAPTPALGDCIAVVMRSAQFAESDQGGSFTYPFVFDGSTTKTASCDAKRLSDEGTEKVAEGAFSAALALFESSLACKSDPQTIRLAFMSACSSRNVAKAKLYYTRMSPADQQKYQQICMRQSIDVTATTGATTAGDPLASQAPPVDCDALRAEGLDYVDKRQHAAALSKFEAALQCKASPEILQLAFTASCNSGDYKKAKLYYPKLAKDAQQKLALACVRMKVPYEDAPAGCDADALKDKGMELVNKGQHSAALGHFEAAMRCKPSDELVQLAFMESCNSLNSAKAQLYFSKLTADQQQRLQVMCVRNKVEYGGPARACDADALKDQGMEAVNKRQHAEALAKFEASLACKSDSDVVELAFMASCNSKSSVKAKKYYVRLTAGQQKQLAPLCQRNNVEYVDASAAAPAACNADDAKEKAMDLVNQGQHAAALAMFEESLRCKPDAYVTQLAFMAACNSKNSPKAKAYYKLLTAAQQNKLSVLCQRNNVDYEDGPKAVAGKGVLEVMCTREAKILVDGVDTGMTTPIRGDKLQLTPGTHNVTFVVDGNRSTYAVDIVAGETLKLSKDLRACNADDAKEKAMDLVNQGQHAAALAMLEESLRCKPDAYVTQLAFMAACNSNNSPKAKAYYKQLTPAQQNKLSIMCQRNNVDYGDGPKAVAGKGVLEVMSTREAKILVDGVDTGMTTPIRGDKLQLTPGKHKVTFVVDGNRFTYAVDIVAGETLKLSKDLR